MIVPKHWLNFMLATCAAVIFLPPLTVSNSALATDEPKMTEFGKWVLRSFSDHGGLIYLEAEDADYQLGPGNVARAQTVSFLCGRQQKGFVVQVSPFENRTNSDPVTVVIVYQGNPSLSISQTWWNGGWSTTNIWQNNSNDEAQTVNFIQQAERDHENVTFSFSGRPTQEDHELVSVTVSSDGFTKGFAAFKDACAALSR
ncbi:MAG TPA: hypothetical protein VMU06_01305 [Stellaceae bacterium]|nr:hypothetical protein [Stellaceae bacterium]